MPPVDSNNIEKKMSKLNEQLNTTINGIVSLGNAIKKVFNIVETLDARLNRIENKLNKLL